MPLLGILPLDNHALYFENTPPTFLEYRELRDSVNWRLTYYEMDGQFLASANSCVTVRSRADQRLQAFGSVRLSRSGFELYDLAVRREWQRIGLGTTIVRRILEYCQDYVNQHDPACSDFRVHAIPGTEAFYARFGLRLLPFQAPGFNEMKLSLRKQTQVSSV